MSLQHLPREQGISLVIGEERMDNKPDKWCVAPALSIHVDFYWKCTLYCIYVIARMTYSLHVPVSENKYDGQINQSGRMFPLQ
jgi:hypothetical protein